MPTTNELVAKVKAAGAISGDDTLAARRAVYGAGTAVAPAAMEMLFAVDEAAGNSVPGWEQLLAEAAVDCLLNQAEPEGYIDDVTADWLVSHIATNGLVHAVNELEMLVHVLEEARSAPPALGLLALKQVRAAVVDGAGPLAKVPGCERGRVSAAETALLRRILYAAGGVGNAITRDEAELIFDINDAARAGDNDPAWADLFVKAVANCIMAASGYAAPPREVALAEEKWLDTPEPGVGGFLGEMAGGLRGIIDAYRVPTEGDWKAHNAAKAKEIAEDEVVTQDEASWLAQRIGRDGVLEDDEKALLRFIRDTAPSVHPALQDLIAKAA